MKTLLIFTLYLISGQVGCFNVTGYPGGKVMIFCTNSVYGIKEKYFCKLNQNQCLNKVVTEVQNRWNQTERFSMIDTPRRNNTGYLTVNFRKLSLQDAGLYQCGETGVWNHTINLIVNSDSCCSGSKTVTGYLGKTLTINCSYPEEFKPNSKFFHKLDSTYLTEMNFTSSQKSRFSISDNTESKVLSVRISDVREEDGGVYYCAVTVGRKSVTYSSLYTEIRLDIIEGPPVRSPSPTLEPTTATYGTSTAAPTVVTSDEVHSSPSALLTVCIYVGLLIGGSVLIVYTLRCKKNQGSTSSTIRDLENSDAISHSTCDYEEIEDSRSESDTKAVPLYSLLQLPTISSDHHSNVYAIAQVLTIPSDHPKTVYTLAQLPQIPFELPDFAHSTAHCPPAPLTTPGLCIQLPTIPSDSPGSLCVTVQTDTN